MIGAMALVSAREFLTLFVAFELLSLPLYALTALDQERRASAEGALKIFLFGTVSSAALILGLGMLFGATGTTFWMEVRTSSPGAPPPRLPFFSGFGFKVACSRSTCGPRTYEAAPTPIVFSLAPKAAGIAALFRLWFEVFEPRAPEMASSIVWIAALTMIVGNLLALPQTNLKRLLAYSGIAHIGYVLTALAAGTGFGAGMALFYFVAYLFSNVVAFLCVAAVEAGGEEPTLQGVRNLVRRSPVVAAAFMSFSRRHPVRPRLLGRCGLLAAGKAGLWSPVFLGAVPPSSPCSTTERRAPCSSSGRGEAIPARPPSSSPSCSARCRDARGVVPVVRGPALAVSGF
jgi:NADH-quinone oxidoreductase subunit N